MKPRQPKTCGKGAGLTWSRRVDAGVVTWFLFRRDHGNRVYQAQVQLGETTTPHYAALVLRNARRRLRDQVDEIDLKALGVAA